jgi:subtilisin family serine protease
VDNRYAPEPEPPEDRASATFTTPADASRTTDSLIVVLEQDAPVAASGLVSRLMGTGLVSTADFDGDDIDAETLGTAEGVLFDKLDVAVVRPDPEQVDDFVSAAAAADQPVALVEPERIVYAADGYPNPLAPGSLAYARAYQDGVADVIERLQQGGWFAAATATPQQTVGVVTPAMDETRATWGLQLTGVLGSVFTGQGVRVAVLDTGIDRNHPDFLGRVKATSSFVTGEDVQDLYGHGTHCAGTACGPLRPSVLPRYGVAHAADLYVGKVLNNRGRGADRQILAGINWAMANQCHVVSMSISGRRLPGERFSSAFEEVARRAMDAGVLLIAAAGNDSDRQNGFVLPVGHPADCPSIMAVAALDVNLQIANFSNSTINVGCQVDVAGPGVAVYSSWPLPSRYRSINGTSMATPHVAGVAALYLEANPNLRPAELSSLLTRDARRLPLPAVDVGSGIVEAP